MNALLQEVLTWPGVVNAAYRAFHNYSLGNQILAAVQLSIKGLPLSPIASFNAWREKGRFVNKGEKAISLFMPVSVKRRAANDATAADAEVGEGGTYSVYMLRPNCIASKRTSPEHRSLSTRPASLNWRYWMGAVHDVEDAVAPPDS